MILSIRRLALLYFFLLPAVYVTAQEPPAPAGPSKAQMASMMYVDAVKARMMGDEKQEEELLRQVVANNPEEAAPYYDLARLSLKQSKVDEAEKLIRKAIERNKENAWYQRLYAEVLAYQNKPEQAAGILKELGKNEKHNTEYLFQAARLYEKAGKYQESLKMLDDMIARIGPEEEVLLQKQLLYLKMNDLSGAVRVAQQLIDQNPRDGRFYANLADLYDNNGQPEKASEIYQKALKEFPYDPTLQYGMATHLKKKGDVAGYDDYIRKTILNPEFDDETQISILITYLQEVNADSVRKIEGVKLTEKIAELQPNNPEVTALYGQVLLNSGEAKKAAEQFKRSLEQDPSRFNVWQQLLLCYTAPADADSLIRYSTKALRYFPNQALVHYFNGIGNYNKKVYPAAIKSINRAIDLQPEESRDLLSDMYSSLGEIYNATKEYKLSDSAYEKSLRLNPDNASVLNNYSYYLSLREQRLEDAARMSLKSLQIRPGEATFLDTYGWILYKQGKYHDARKYIEDALKANPDADGTLWEHLGDVYFRLNDVSKAVEYWKTAKEKGTENTEIDKKIQDRKLYD
ncbi:MAG: tetratricopeptide repeat protein [Sphingobacteriales bacterium]|nr:MAG: tetratricopeptide repeat protein [Sphingobacteriales bacterium]